jgi:hypothetical protein
MQQLFLLLIRYSLIMFDQLVFLPETVCINLASSNGLGRHQDALSDSSFESYSKVSLRFHYNAAC